MNPFKNEIIRERVRVGDLEEIYSRCGSNPQLFPWVISALEILEPDQMWRGLWLLRRLAKTRAFSEQELTALAERADGATNWKARLNLCQLLAITGIPAPVREVFFPFLRESFVDRRPIIRAWAISTLVTFEGDRRFQSEIAAMLLSAQRERGKAMQARLRRLRSSR